NGGNNRASQPRSEAAGYSDWGTLRIHNANPAHMRLTSRPANTSDGRCQAAVTIDPVIRAIASAPTAEINKDRKSTRLNSSHVSISYAVFCLKKKNYENRTNMYRINIK